MTRPQRVLIYFVVFFVFSYILPFKLWVLCMIAIILYGMWYRMFRM